MQEFVQRKFFFVCVTFAIVVLGILSRIKAFIIGTCNSALTMRSQQQQALLLGFNTSISAKDSFPRQNNNNNMGRNRSDFLVGKRKRNSIKEGVVVSILPFMKGRHFKSSSCSDDNRLFGIGYRAGIGLLFETSFCAPEKKSKVVITSLFLKLHPHAV